MGKNLTPSVYKKSSLINIEDMLDISAKKRTFLHDS